ncbi:MAG: MBL fold metallo-hydrolase [Chitinophagales bacterium]|nr:MBL fold metallo-hydrolase [Chitinophagales bacterium]
MKIQFRHNHITVFESALYRTTTTLIALDQAILIIDPNWLPVEIDYIVKYVTHNYKNHKQYLIFTHSDYDHIIGYCAFPGAEVIATIQLAENPYKEQIIDEIQSFDNTYYINRDYPIRYPDVNWVILHDGQTMHIGGCELIFYHAQGHCADALFVVIPNYGIWIAGDYLSNIEIPLIDDNLIAYTKTLEKAKNIFHQYPSVHILIPGHGDTATHRLEIKRRIHNDKKYLDLLQQPDSENREKEIKQHLKSYSDNPNLLAAHLENMKKITG